MPLHTDGNEIVPVLVERAREGDQQAMYRLYKLYVQAMYNVSLRIVANKMDAEDVLQEAFTSAFQNLGQFKGKSTFGVWLRQIVINKSVNHLRRQRQWFTDLDEVQLVADEEPETNEVFEQISPQMVNDAITTLPQKARVVLNLYLLEGYQHKEVAEMLGISESTSKSQYQRARRMLQERLKEKVAARS